MNPTLAPLDIETADAELFTPILVNMPAVVPSNEPAPVAGVALGAPVPAIWLQLDTQWSEVSLAVFVAPDPRPDHAGEAALFTWAGDRIGVVSNAALTDPAFALMAARRLIRALMTQHDPQHIIATMMKAAEKRRQL